MRVRRVLVGLAISGTALAAPDHAAALRCLQSPESQTFAAASVIEATITACRPVNQLFRLVYDWYRGQSPLGPDRYELVLDDVQLLRGVATNRVRTRYESLEPGRRYVFAARRSSFGTLSVGPCYGLALDGTQAADFKAWLRSLPHPASGEAIAGSP